MGAVDFTFTGRLAEPLDLIGVAIHGHSQSAEVWRTLGAVGQEWRHQSSGSDPFQEPCDSSTRNRVNDVRSAVPSSR